MSAALAFQQWARGRLAADAGVLALVPADNIIDANGRPEVFPKIVLGEDQEVPADSVVGRYARLYATLQLWDREPGLASVKAIAGVAVSALRQPNTLAFTIDGYRCIDCRLDSSRFIRDPDGITSHGIVTMQATIEEV